MVPMSVRQDHSTAASSSFTILGTTHAVLLAFVAMLASEGCVKAQSITDTEASLTQNVYQLIVGLNGPDMAEPDRERLRSLQQAD